MKVGGIWEDKRVIFAGEELERKGEFHLSGQLYCSGRQRLMEDPCRCQARMQCILTTIGDLNRKLPLKSKMQFCSSNILGVFFVWSGDVAGKTEEKLNALIQCF